MESFPFNERKEACFQRTVATGLIFIIKTHYFVVHGNNLAIITMYKIKLVLKGKSSFTQQQSFVTIR